jgi:hypothetical protein
MSSLPRHDAFERTYNHLLFNGFISNMSLYAKENLKTFSCGFVVTVLLTEGSKMGGQQQQPVCLFRDCSTLAAVLKFIGGTGNSICRGRAACCHILSALALGKPHRLLCLMSVIFQHISTNYQ